MSDPGAFAPPTLEKDRADGEAGRPARPSGPEAERTPRPRRFWSARRVPAGLLAVVLLAGVVLLLIDLVAVRAGEPAMAWRRWLADELATRRLGDAAVVTGAVVAALLGLWLLVLALTPGLRSLLPLSGAPGLRAGLDRSAAAAILREEAVRVPGVQTADVTVRRRRAKVRATAHFREVEDVRTDLTGVLADTLVDLGPARRPKLSVRVSRPKKG
ncbi:MULTISPECIES: DUF6286 domain-containing protein [Streptomyces]|uniref:DUF6286 domain-containing protein n=1 Tax=Streptomyces TaxID=1883 RepID=UPI0022489A33|nr:DUF6286 domain-containing protein [Streptomyces sp. JHD 1]MCX2971312.1 DUF6286 domain-containing protein [Streptomyces sp. JHD 1]